MTGRKPFCDRDHNTELITKICDGLRPSSIDTNAPKGYSVELMKKCWHSNPNKRPTANELLAEIREIRHKEAYSIDTNIPKIEPTTTNNPGAIYKSRPLSVIIKSAESTRSLRSIAS